MSIGTYELPSTSMKYVRFRSVVPSPPTLHEHFELIHIVRGTAVFNIDDREIALNAGDITFTPSFCVHCSIGSSEDLIADALVFSPHVCSGTETLFANKHLLSPVLRKDEIPPLLFHLVSKIFSRVSRYAENDTNVKFVYPLTPRDCTVLIPYIAATMAELSAVLPTEKAEFRDYNLMHAILSYCSKNYTTEISRESVAEACGVCPNTVSKVFSSLNVTFSEHINTLRVNLAYRLLTETNLSVGAIMTQCGYINQGTFNRNFMSAFGASPKSVQKNRSRGTDPTELSNL